MEKYTVYTNNAGIYVLLLVMLLFCLPVAIVEIVSPTGESPLFGIILLIALAALAVLLIRKMRVAIKRKAPVLEMDDRGLRVLRAQATVSFYPWGEIEEISLQKSTRIGNSLRLTLRKPGMFGRGKVASISLINALGKDEEILRNARMMWGRYR